MAKFSDAKCSGATDPKLQASHNHLIDLLNTGQVFEMTVNGHAIRIVLNREGFTGTIDGVSMFGLDPVTGKFAIGTYEDLITSLGNLALLDVVETTELGASIFDGTHINASLIEKNLYIQDAEPTVVIPSLWLETASGAPKSLWLVTSASLELLIVAGGGGGGKGLASTYQGGGGGGGGVIYDGTFNISIGVHAITVGNGGDAASNGSDSSFDSTVAVGGGRGGGVTAASVGGSGGGSSSTTVAGGTTDQGFAGGTTNAAGGSGGGGGKGEIGSNGTASISGDGGDGGAYAISGISTYYGGGGGGGANTLTAGIGGLGGGGDGGKVAVGEAGEANTGGGGGGGSSNASRDGGGGGSGVVIVRYVTAEFGTCTGGSKTTDGAYTIHTFIESGTLTVVGLPI